MNAIPATAAAQAAQPRSRAVRRRTGRPIFQCNSTISFFAPPIAPSRILETASCFETSNSGDLDACVEFPDLHVRIEDVVAAYDRVADGLIAEEWICSDTATLFQQLH